MIKLKPLTIILFLCAVAAYIVAPPVGAGLLGIGVLFELAGWVSVIRDHQHEKKEDSEA